jgi:hypothetical protein
MIYSANALAILGIVAMKNSILTRMSRGFGIHHLTLQLVIK